MSDPAATSAPRIPRDKTEDYTNDQAAARRDFVREQTGAELMHVGRHSFDPGILRGNVENFTGVAQVPIGVAGPIRINGEHARGDFYVPLATTEGTLVASYNRGMRLLTECGGVKTTVVEHSMQRAPVFICDDALAARELGVWIEQHFDDIKAAAETTTRSGKLRNIGQYALGPLRYLRMNYAAGQNMTGKATLAACEWIMANYPERERMSYLLSGNIDTDKKHSQINMLLTRGKRVVAEAVIKLDVFKRLMGVDTAELFHHRQISMSGAFLVGAANNGAHAANGLTAMFIATGQDVANVGARSPSEIPAGAYVNESLPARSSSARDRALRPATAQSHETLVGEKSTGPLAWRMQASANCGSQHVRRGTSLTMETVDFA